MKRKYSIVINPVIEDKYSVVLSSYILIDGIKTDNKSENKVNLTFSQVQELVKNLSE